MIAGQERLNRELRQTFRSLRHRNYRLYFCGQAVSLSGTWMQSLAVSWLVYRMTHSAWLLGVVAFAGLAPILVLGLWGGWVADRFDRRRVLLCTQTLAMLQAGVLAGLTFSGLLQIWHVVALAAFLGIVNAFEMPARQAFVVNMVERDDYVNAVSLNSSLFHASRTVGPALAGFLVGLAGEAFCFAINTASYLAALIAIFMIKLADKRESGSNGEESSRTIDALKFAFTTPHVRNVLILGATASLFGMQYMVLLPVIAAEVLHKQAGGLGALMAGAGIGSCLAALVLANRGQGEELKQGVGYASLGFSLSLIGFCFSHEFYLSLLLTVFVGFFMALQLSGSHSLLQLAVSDRLRGRLMSIWMMNMLGLLPLGSLAVGWLAHRFGTPETLAACGGVCFIAALTYIAARRD